jgi:hypothetical protein
MQLRTVAMEGIGTFSHTRERGIVLRPEPK